MSDPNYGKMYVIRALKEVLSNPKATVKQKLDAAHLIATIHGWTEPKSTDAKKPDKLIL